MLSMFAIDDKGALKVFLFTRRRHENISLEKRNTLRTVFAC